MTLTNQNAIVQYHTDLNDVVFKNFKAVELNLFFAICSLLKNCGTETVTLKISDIKKIANYTNRNKKRFEPDLINTIDKGKTLPFVSHSPFPGQNMKLFDMDKTSIDFQERKLYIKLTSYFSYILNDFNEESVYFPMYLFTDLHSIYSKNVYRLFLQYEREEEYNFSIGMFREFLDLEEKYQHMKDMDKRVFKMVNDELGSYYDVFKFKKIVKKPLKVIGIRYVFYNEIK